MTMTTAALVCLGDELLDGRVRDANTPTIAGALASHHIALTLTTFVRDDPDTILETLRAQLRSGTRLVIVTGGLGPTEDDRTRQVAARLINAPLVRDDAALARMEARFASRDRTMTPNNLIQANFPQGATILPSEVGTASGFMLDLEETRLVFLPGVPREVSWFISAQIGAMLHGLGVDTTRPIHTRHMTLFGQGESFFEQEVLPLPELTSRVGLAWCANDPIIELKLSSTHEPDLEHVHSHILNRIGRYAIAHGTQSGFERLGELLIESGGSVTCAESCTGGMISAAMTGIPGSSGWFGRGFVTYSNQSKQELVGVLATTLEAHGAVSAQTVAQMAAGAARAAGATHAIAVSGIAGPGGGTPDKPVGTVHFAMACPHGVYHHHAVMHGHDRAQVRQRSVYIGLSMLLWSLLSESAAIHECIVALTGPHDEDALWRPQGLSLPSPTESSRP